MTCARHEISTRTTLSLQVRQSLLQIKTLERELFLMNKQYNEAETNVDLDESVLSLSIT